MLWDSGRDGRGCGAATARVDRIGNVICVGQFDVVRTSSVREVSGIEAGPWGQIGVICCQGSVGQWVCEGKCAG
jgi:hypothetical protein